MEKIKVSEKDLEKLDTFEGFVDGVSWTKISVYKKELRLCTVLVRRCEKSCVSSMFEIGESVYYVAYTGKGRIGITEATVLSECRSVPNQVGNNYTDFYKTINILRNLMEDGLAKSRKEFCVEKETISNEEAIKKLAESMGCSTDEALCLIDDLDVINCVSGTFASDKYDFITRGNSIYIEDEEKFITRNAFFKKEEKHVISDEVSKKENSLKIYAFSGAIELKCSFEKYTETVERIHGHFNKRTKRYFSRLNFYNTISILPKGGENE